MKNINDKHRVGMQMMEDRWGLWHFIRHPERKPLTREELEILLKASDCYWSLWQYPKENLTEEQHNVFKINQYEKR